MRVFAPERLVTRNVYGRDLFMPIVGIWKQLPDYFKQVTNGNAINDVVHAKLVDEMGDSFVYPDLLTSTKGKSLQLTQTNHSKDWYYVGISRYHYRMVQRFVELAPSPNYKGKKKQRKRFVQRWIPEGFAYTAWFWSTSKVIDHRAIANNRRGYIPQIGIQVMPEDPNTHYYGGYRVLNLEIGGKWTETAPDHWEFSLVIQNWPDNRLYELFKPVADYCQTLQYPSRNAPAYEVTQTRVAQIVETVMRESGEEIRELLTARCIRAKWHVYTCTYFLPVDTVDQIAFPEISYRDAFLLHEPDIIGDRLDPILLGKGGGISHYWIEYLTQHALLEACDSLPRLSDNSISNIIEIVGFIKALVVDHKIEIPESLADAWLAYRYQYNTSKQDVNDAIKFVHRHMDLGTLDRMIVGRGTSHTSYLGFNVTCRCSVEVTPKETNWLSKIWRALDQYGLTPDFYTIWDMVPYSFMVDWFLPIGDLAGVWDANSMYFSGEYYNLANICYSLSYVRELERADGNVDSIKCYTRWAGSVPSSLNSFYWFEPPTASSRTVGRRVLDAASIFIGR